MKKYNWSAISHDELNQIVSIEAAVTDFTDLEEDCYLLLHITFTRGSGNMEINVPAFDF